MADTFEADPSRVASVFGSILSAIGGFADPAEAAQMTGTTTGNEASASTDTALSTAPPTIQTNASGFVKPYEGDVGINQPFGGPGGHPGIDFAVPNNSHLIAAINGTVTVAGLADPGGYGNEVEIRGDNGIIIRYGHLSSINVKPGDTVSAGQVIGNSGGVAGAPGSGNSTGPHLHFEVRVNGQAVDPTPFLAGGASVVATGTVDNPKPYSPEEIMGAQLGNIAAAITGSGETRDVSKPRESSSGTTTATVAGSAQSTGNFPEDILRGIGAPVTPENIRVISAWMQAEGGAVHNNPLNTTQDAPGASNWNSIGVKTYPDYQTGLQATIQTLLNGRYGNIIAALKAGTSALAVADAITNSPWGTGALVKKILGAG